LLVVPTSYSHDCLLAGGNSDCNYLVKTA